MSIQIYYSYTGSWRDGDLEEAYRLLPSERRQMIAGRLPEDTKRAVIGSSLLLAGLFMPFKGGQPEEIHPKAVMEHLHAAADRIPAWTVSSKGKPFADGVLIENTRKYGSLSHSGECAAAAVATVPIGVDVQQFTKLSEIKMHKIARRFHPSARSLLAAKTKKILQDQFYRVWTAMESVMKLYGQGFALPMSSIALQPDGDNGFLATVGTDNLPVRLYSVKNGWMAVCCGETADPSSTN